jgi:DivIVA domain-containing protein
MAIDARFDVVLRGYDRAEVDATVRAVTAALESQDPAVRSAAGQGLASRTFRRNLRGYDSEQVDAFLREAASMLALPAE